MLEDGEEETNPKTKKKTKREPRAPLLLPAGMLLRTAEANVVASATRGVVRLTIHYTSYAPTRRRSTIGGRHKGSLQLGDTKLGRSRVLLSEHLSDREMARCWARAFVVRWTSRSAVRCQRFEPSAEVEHGGDSTSPGQRPRPLRGVRPQPATRGGQVPGIDLVARSDS